MTRGTEDKPITFKEACDLRDSAVAELKQATRSQEAKADDQEYIDMFTCSTCYFLAWCEFAYDLYNTHGDCLQTK